MLNSLSDSIYIWQKLKESNVKQMLSPFHSKSNSKLNIVDFVNFHSSSISVPKKIKIKVAFSARLYNKIGCPLQAGIPSVRSHSCHVPIFKW